jgi:hypothetical protein
MPQVVHIPKSIPMAKNLKNEDFEECREASLELEISNSNVCCSVRSVGSFLQSSKKKLSGQVC